MSFVYIGLELLNPAFLQAVFYIGNKPEFESHDL